MKVHYNRNNLFTVNLKSAYSDSRKFEINGYHNLET